MPANRFVCVHGHFYQPPRENVWLEAIEVQPSAYPYHDWNERINSECYWPNAASQVLDDKNRVIQVVNNYSRMSFDFGPTLLSWLETKAPETYQAVLSADKESLKLYSGHGSAMAQAYNHIIMPLAKRRDKYTQVYWGMKDFEHRFGRAPEGMWLPETAVDLETLDIMAGLGIKFTILVPRQAAAIRPLVKTAWLQVSGATLDTTMPYLVMLPSGRQIAVFFYHGGVASAVAFQGLLSSGEVFANRMTGIFTPGPRPQLAHIATDGESYGHHHRFGEMALTYALRYIEEHSLAQITNYGEYLEKHPPTHEVRILENTSWSCSHGVERWRSNCGCNDGSRPGWLQEWRKPLRDSLDFLRDETTPGFESLAGQYLKDPWQARNEYIQVVLDRKQDKISSFIADNSARPLNPDETVTAMELMDLQHHAMLMYTSCGWFFDDLARIETVQILQYAVRVLQLSQKLFGDNLESRFLQILKNASSNLPEYGNGRQIYERFARRALVDLKSVMAHFAMNSIFGLSGNTVHVYCYTVSVHDFQRLDCGRGKVIVGRAKVVSDVTGDFLEAAFSAINAETSGIRAAVKDSNAVESYDALMGEMTLACNMADAMWVTRLLDKHLGAPSFAFSDLFRDEQYRVLANILNTHVPEIDPVYRQIYQAHYVNLPLVNDSDNPLPGMLHIVAEFLINQKLIQALSDGQTGPEAIEDLLNDAKWGKIHLDSDGLGHALGGLLEKKISAFIKTMGDTRLINEILTLLELSGKWSLPVNVHRLQYYCYRLVGSIYPSFRQKAAEGSVDAGMWVAQFSKLCEILRVKVG